MEHTPTPWKVYRRDKTQILEADGIATLAQCPTDNLLRQRAEANAVFIVRAVNSHDEMLAALEFVQRALAAYRDEEPIPAHPVHGELTLEEVKYCVIDPAIANATKGITPAEDRRDKNP